MATTQGSRRRTVVDQADRTREIQQLRGRARAQAARAADAAESVESLVRTAPGSDLVADQVAKVRKSGALGGTQVEGLYDKTAKLAGTRAAGKAFGRAVGKGVEGDAKQAIDSVVIDLEKERGERGAGRGKKGEQEGGAGTGSGSGSGTGESEGQGTGRVALEALPQKPVRVAQGAELPGAEAVEGRRRVERRSGARAESEATHQPSEESVTEARDAVKIPVEEGEGARKGELAGEIVDNPPPDAEIEKLCDKLRSEIGKRRPKDKDDFDKTDPAAMAKAAGDVVSGDVQGEVAETEGGYKKVNDPVAAEAPRAPTDMPAPEPAPAVDSVQSQQAVPEPLKPEEVSLEKEKKETDDVWRDAHMETPEAEAIQDGPIAEARKAKGEFDRFAGERPKAALLADGDVRKRANEALAAAEKAAERQMGAARQRGLEAVKGRKQALKKGEELKREQVAAQMQAIYEGARSRVNAKLQGMVPAALAQWQDGIAPLTQNFKGHIERVRAKIEERHSGVGGFFTGLWDGVVGLPDEITKEYDVAERDFVDGACNLARSISSWVRGVTDDCKRIIGDARKELDQYVSALPEDLRKGAEAEKQSIERQFDDLGKAVDDARKDFTKQLAKELQKSTDEVRDELDRLRDEAKGLLGKFKDFMSEFIDDPLRAIIDGTLRILGIDPAKFWGLLSRAGSAVKAIVKDFVGFAGRLLSAVSTGFKQFGGHILQHLQEGFLNWLFNKAGEAGISIPKEFSLKGIFNLILQMLGLGWQWIRGRLAKLIGEKNVGLIEKAWDTISTFVEKGIAGVVDWIREKLDVKSIIEGVLDAIKSFIIQNVVTKAILWVVSLFNPASALLKAVELVYRIVTWVMDNASRIFSFIEAVMGSMAEIAAGNIGKAAGWIEKALANMIPMVLDLLAKLLGLSALPKKIQEIVKGIQDRIHAAIDKALDWVVAKVKALWKKAKSAISGSGKGAKGAKPGEGEEDAKGKKDETKPGDKKDPGFGPDETFTDGAETHRLFVSDPKAGKAQMMMASTPMPMVDQLARIKEERKKVIEAEGQGRNSPERQEFGKKIGQVYGLVNKANVDIKAVTTKTGVQGKDDKDTGDPKRDEVRNSKRQLAALMQELYQKFLAKPDDAALHDERQRFEDDLGGKAYGDPRSYQTMKAMCKKAWAYIEASAAVQAINKTKDDIAKKVEEIAKKTGGSLDAPGRFIGQVGKSYDRIKAIFEGAGNLEEMTTHLTGFQAGVFGKDLLSLGARESRAILERLRKMGVDVDAILERRKKVLAGKKRVRFTNAMGQSDVKPEEAVKPNKLLARAGRGNEEMKPHNKEGMDYKRPPTAVGNLAPDRLRAFARSVKVDPSGKDDRQIIAEINAIPDDVLQKLELPARKGGQVMTWGGEKHPDAWSARKRADANRQGSGVSPEDQDAASMTDPSVMSSRQAEGVSPMGEEYLPTIEGDLANILYEFDPFIEASRAMSMPLRAGASGTTERFVQMAEYFNLSVVNTRLAMYGHLIPIHAHSYHEISTAAKGHGGLTYVKGDYTHIAPLADSWEKERRAKISRPEK